MYHEDSIPTSLYVDHECKSGLFPNVTTHILADHNDEVWRLEWSPDGMCLASAGKDKLVVIWQLKVSFLHVAILKYYIDQDKSTPKEGGGSTWSVLPKAHLKGHSDPVEALAWSPDGKKLATASDKSVSVFTMNGSDEAVPTAGHQPHTDTVSAIQWMPDGSEFVATSMDYKLVFYVRPSSGPVRRLLTNAEPVGVRRASIDLARAADQGFCHHARRLAHRCYLHVGATHQCGRRKVRSYHFEPHQRPARRCDRRRRWRCRPGSGCGWLWV